MTTYITETFGMIKDAFAFGYNTLSTILSSIGLPIQVYFAIFIGFAVVGMILSTVMDFFRGSADSSVGLADKYAQMERRRNSRSGGSAYHKSIRDAQHARENELRVAADRAYTSKFYKKGGRINK